MTNDDGIHAQGLAVLARALANAGHDITVVAPLREASGAGAGVGPIHAMGGGIGLEPATIDGLAAQVVLGADCLPALIVIAACLGAFGAPPDLVCAGINPGRNVGRAVLHSGTVGAALTSVHFARRGLAVSIQAGAPSTFESAGSSLVHFETAAALAVDLARHLELAPACTVWNLNVPNLPREQLQGIRRAHLATSGLVRSAVAGQFSSGVRFELGIATPEEGDESDEALTSLGFAVVTPLASVTEDLRPEVAAVLDRALGAPHRPDQAVGAPSIVDLPTL